MLSNSRAASLPLNAARPARQWLLLPAINKKLDQARWLRQLGNRIAHCKVAAVPAEDGATFLAVPIDHNIEKLQCCQE